MSDKGKITDEQYLELALSFGISGFEPDAFIEGGMKSTEKGRYTHRSTAIILKSEVLKLQKQLKDSISKEELRKFIKHNYYKAYSDCDGSTGDYVTVDDLNRLLGNE